MQTKSLFERVINGTLSVELFDAQVGNRDLSINYDGIDFAGAATVGTCAYADTEELRIPNQNVIVRGGVAEVEAIKDKGETIRVRLFFSQCLPFEAD